VLFGGTGVRLNGGRFVRFTPNRSTNDLWTACAPAFGLQSLIQFGTPGLNAKPLEGLFA
jgi:hypothetical protein